MAGTVHIPWYATGLRGDKLEAALLDVTPSALRYSATGWSLQRSQDDRYKFLQIVHFDDKTDFDRWWQGREMIEFRAITSGWWQVPVLYTPHDLVGEGRVAPAETVTAAAPAEPEPAAAS